MTDQGMTLGEQADAIELVPSPQDLLLEAFASGIMRFFEPEIAAVQGEVEEAKDKAEEAQTQVEDLESRVEEIEGYGLGYIDWYALGQLDLANLNDRQDAVDTVNEFEERIGEAETSVADLGTEIEKIWKHLASKKDLTVAPADQNQGDLAYNWWSERDLRLRVLFCNCFVEMGSDPKNIWKAATEAINVIGRSPNEPPANAPE